MLIPAAIGHVLTDQNAREVKARYVIEAANGPCTAKADEIFRSRNVLCVPDIFANAGGVTVSYFEWAQNIQKYKWSESKINDELEQHMVRKQALAARSPVRGLRRWIVTIIGIGDFGQNTARLVPVNASSGVMWLVQKTLRPSCGHRRRA